MEPLGPSLSPLSAGQVLTKVGGLITGKPTQTIFDPVRVPEKYRALLGADTGAAPAAFDRASIDPTLNDSISKGFAFQGPLGFQAVDKGMRAVPHREALAELGYTSRFSPADIASMDQQAKSILSHADPMDARDRSMDTVGRVGPHEGYSPFDGPATPDNPDRHTG